MNHCFVCQKHADMDQVPGGAIAEDAHVVVSHLPLLTPQGEADSVYLGHLVVEPREHVAELGDLSDDQAASFGVLAASCGPDR